MVSKRLNRTNKGSNKLCIIKYFLPTDGSEHAEVALEHAIDLAQKYDAQLHVLYVVDVELTQVLICGQTCLKNFKL